MNDIINFNNLSFILEEYHTLNVPLIDFSINNSDNINTLNIFFLDAILYFLCLAIKLFKIRPDRLNVLCMIGPDFFQRNTLDKIFKFTLVKEILKYDFFYLFLRTQELANSWKEELPEFACKINYLPSLELNDIEISSVENNNHKKPQAAKPIVFLVSGQIRPEKSIEQLVRIFAGNNFPAQLRIVGSIIDTKLKEFLNQYTSHDNIYIKDHFLNEQEMFAELHNSSYNVMLYDPWDERMESAMLFMSLKYQIPVVCYDSGWLGNHVKQRNLGWTIAKRGTHKYSNNLVVDVKENYFQINLGKIVKKGNLKKINGIKL
jgi:glycosyltransferase involved in cell wall biosynthesis